MPTPMPQAIQISAYDTINRPSNQQQRIFLKVQGGRIEGRTPTHFICLLDTSGSMETESRLQNCIDSLKYVARFLTDDDYFTLITFSDSAHIRAHIVQMDEVGKASILRLLDQTRSSGSTNLGSALERLTEVLRSCTEHFPALKQGVLLLTDGYVNMGLVDTNSLTNMVSDFMTEFPRASLTAVGYGTEHNVQLLNEMSTRATGTYNIVRNRDDVASVFGAVMGSLVSCVGLNLRVLAPRGTTIHEERHMEDVEETLAAISLGDVYAETTTTIELALPVSPIPLTHIRLQVYDVLSRSAYDTAIEIQSETDEIGRERALYCLRQEIAKLLREVGARTSNTSIPWLLGQANTLNEKVEALMVSWEAGRPILQVLRQEIYEAKTILERMRDRPLYEATEDMTIMAQHARYLSQGSGTRATSGGIVLSQAVTQDPFMSPFARHVSGGAVLSARTDHETEDPAFDSAHLTPPPLLRTPPRNVGSAIPLPPPPVRHGGLRRMAAMYADGQLPSPIPDVEEDEFPTSLPGDTTHLSTSTIRSSAEFVELFNRAANAEPVLNNRMDDIPAGGPAIHIEQPLFYPNGQMAAGGVAMPLSMMPPLPRRFTDLPPRPAPHT